MIAVTITIGRNYGTHPAAPRHDEPMSLSSWHAFIGRVKLSLSDREPVSLEVKRGVGFWEGKREDSASVTALFESFADWRRFDLKRELVVVASVFWQDAIALSVGQSELVHA